MLQINTKLKQVENSLSQLTPIIRSGPESRLWRSILTPTRLSEGSQTKSFIALITPLFIKRPLRNDFGMTRNQFRNCRYISVLKYRFSVLF